MATTKQCPRCLALKPITDYCIVQGRPKGACKTCRSAKARLRRAGGVPVTQPTTQPPKKAKRPAPTLLTPAPLPPRNRSDRSAPDRFSDRFSDRKSLGDSIRNALSKTLDEYDRILADLDDQYDAASASGQWADAQRAIQNRRSTIQAKSADLMKLTRQWELLSEFDRPAEENPEFAPVVLHLDFTPPAEAYAAPLATIPPDDIQPRDPA